MTTSPHDESPSTHYSHCRPHTFTGMSDYISSQYITTYSGDLIQTVKTHDTWGVTFFPLPATRYAPASLFTPNLTVGEPWTLTVTFDSTGWNNTATWPCQLSKFTPWETGVGGGEALQALWPDAQPSPLTAVHPHHNLPPPPPPHLSRLSPPPQLLNLSPIPPQTSAPPPCRQLRLPDERPADGPRRPHTSAHTLPGRRLLPRGHHPLLQQPGGQLLRRQPRGEPLCVSVGIQCGGL